MRQCAPRSVCLALYHTAILWAILAPCYGLEAVSNTDPIHKGMNQIHTPTQKSVSIDTSGDGVNLPDCTDLRNRLKIERVPMPSKLSVYQLRPLPGLPDSTITIL